MSKEAVAVLGGGCFWCLEAAFQTLPGVIQVESGYAGGSREHPSYEQVCTGLTGHAEVVRVVFDPERLPYRRLLEYFFGIHDPTTEDRQGADIGSQYRSIILYTDENQGQEAEVFIKDQAVNYRNPIVSDVVPLSKFWPAEPEHQDFFRRNPDYGYCRMVVRPKVDKIRKLIETQTV
ncbi:MAG: peptide-methionine (S)-S-oxide reductase MsrA [Spirochaetes bacterium]|nr:peptide-methionine (S)-S-oxide reductase MsrA [Spirochaetota bacterium]MBU0954684.1 peptide-methionine (S)-S-oxide reductase MsrA [Spirochaetota bacterium]